MGVASFSIFSVLVGAGSWLCGSPPPTWFPWRSPWLALNLVVGLVLVPVWVWLGFVAARNPERHPPEPPEEGEAEPAEEVPPTDVQPGFAE